MQRLDGLQFRATPWPHDSRARGPVPSSMPSSMRGREHLPERRTGAGHVSTAAIAIDSTKPSLAAKASNIWAFAMLGSDEAPEE